MPFALVGLFSLTLLWLGCELTLEGEPPPLAVSHEPFHVTNVSLQNGTLDVPLNQPVTFEFNHYLDRDSFEYYNAVTLQSGYLSTPGVARYWHAGRTIEFFPSRDMRPGLNYVVRINADTVRSLDGSELAQPAEVMFQTASEGTVEVSRDLPVLSFETDVRPLFEARCGGCHGPDSALVQLDYETLSDRESSQIPGRDLVVPFAPETSYLLHKVLTDYPDRRLDPMPPIWSADEGLSVEQQRVVEQWIVSGARP
ncbi:MAG: Ig-like domain-containing protein [Myxococcales bacterium]|nr:Ig-like domain-containing protein [Myxococcales bacterium]